MYKGTLIAVKDMEESKIFYHDILDMNVVGDFGANVQLDGGLCQGVFGKLTFPLSGS